MTMTLGIRPRGATYNPLTTVPAASQPDTSPSWGVIGEERDLAEIQRDPPTPG